MNNLKFMYEGFLKSARKYPHQDALSINDRRWSYSDIEADAKRWAQALLSYSNQLPKTVGIFAYRSYTSYTGVMASLLAGATFVPLNRFFPLSRTRTMIQLAQLDAIIVDQQSFPYLKEVLDGIESPPLILAPETEEDNSTKLLDIHYRIVSLNDLNRIPLLKDPVAVHPDDVAYLLFTSGSTGLPKGVPVTHSNVFSFLQFNQNRYQVTSQDRLSQTFDQTFDLSIFDIFMAWNAGACLYVITRLELLSPIRFIQENAITIWFSVPSVASLLLKRKALLPQSLPSIRLSLFCGEALPQKIAEAWQAAAHHSVLENLYGPTELTVACSAYRWKPAFSSSECVNGIVPIGRIYDGLTAVLLDESLSEVTDNGPGELCISGPQMFPGYLQNQGQTQAVRYIRKSPLGSEQVFYRTGDIVRKTEWGEYVFLGRKDSQIKVSGYRVELGEIEAALLRIPQITQAAVVADAERIIAFYTGENLASSWIQENLKKTLPVYMLPKHLEWLEALPLNSSGKVHRKLLMERLGN